MSEGIWRAVVEAHERELMMQQERSARCECGQFKGECGSCRGYGGVPGRPVKVTPAELMAREARLRQAMSAPLARVVAREGLRLEVEGMIAAYARKLERQRVAVLRDNRLWDQARALLVGAGAEPPR